MDVLAVHPENLAKAIALVVLGLDSAIAQIETVPGDWPRWRGANADGRWNPPALPQDLADQEPKRLWTTKIGGGYSGVTVANGRIHVMDRQTQPREAERALCFDARDGALLWEHSWPAEYGKLAYGSGPRASVTVEREDGGSRAYTLGALGKACCLDAETGSLLWERDTVAEFGARVPEWGFAASPFVWQDKVILHVGAEKGGSLLALDKRTGREIWRAGADPAGYCTPQIIEHAGGRQLIAWGPEHIQSFDPDTGAAHWTHPYKITYGVSIAQPIYADGILAVCGYWHGAKALQLGATAREVKLLWENEKDICGLMSAPLFKDGLVYVLDKNKGLVCFELATGRIHWHDDNQLTPAGRNPHFSMVWLDEARAQVALLNANGELIYAQLTSTGAEQRARHQIIGKTWAHPAFAGNLVYVRSDTELAAWQLWPR